MVSTFVQKLRGLAVLDELERAALEEVTRQQQSFGPRKDLIREGDQSGPVFVMVEGWAFRYKFLPSGTRQIVAFLMPGDVCDLRGGMLAAMDHGIQTATQATVATISRGRMDHLMSSHRGIARAMYVSQMVDQETLRAWIVSLGRRSSVARAAHLLLELFIRGVRAGVASHGQMDLPLSQAVLADALGMTPVHINRVLQELRRSGAIELQRGVLRICDPAALIPFSGFDDGHLHRQLGRAPR